MRRQGNEARRGARTERNKLLTSRTVTRVAFIVIIVFVTAQMAWWVYFQQRYATEVTSATLASQQREAASMTALLEQGATAEVERLLAASPHLRLADGRIEVDPAATHEFIGRQRAVVRMFAFEGPFFVLVVMTGLFIISRSLRLERELKRRQSNFLDAIGHEYKTPISTLRLLLETLQLRDPAPAKRQEYLQRMGAEIDRLERTGQQVLATARLEAGALDDGPRPHDLTALVRQVVDRARTGLEARGALLRLEAARGELPVLADLDDVAIVLENLLDNAVKYTPGEKKPVTVSVSGQGGWAVLAVEDRGRGIPERERRLVFDRFYRVGNELTRSASGMGLGLYLVQRTASARGGSVRVEGVDGGTRVLVLLPLHTASAPLPLMPEAAL